MSFLRGKSWHSAMRVHGGNVPLGTDERGGNVPPDFANDLGLRMIQVPKRRFGACHRRST